MIDSKATAPSYLHVVISGLLLVAFYFLYLWNLRSDPSIVSWGGVFLSDEGWYSKSARSLYLWGKFPDPTDFSPLSHTFLQVIFQYAVFKIAGVQLWALRFFTAFSWLLSLSFLSWTLARRNGREVGLSVALFLLGSPLVFAFSRLAIADPLALSATTLALACHFQTLESPQESSFGETRRRSGFHRAGLDLLCLGFALAACFFKLSYAFVLPACILCMARRERSLPADKRRWGEFWGVSSTASLSLAAGLWWIHGQFLASWNQFTQMNVRARSVNDFGGWLFNVLEMVAHDLWHTALLFPLLWVLAILWKLRAHKASTWISPEIWPLFLLLVLGWMQRSVISFHRPRYALFVLLTLGIAIWITLWRLYRRQLVSRAAIGITTLLWALGSSPVLYRAWSWRDNPKTLHETAAEIAAQVKQHRIHRSPRPQHDHGSEESILLGRGEASLVALFDTQLRVIDLSNDPKQLCERIRGQSPEYVLIDQSWSERFRLPTLLSTCVSRSWQELGRWTVLRNYANQGPWILYYLSPNSKARHNQ